MRVWAVRRPVIGVADFMVEMERVETKIAYLEQATAELSDELYRQQQLIEALKAKLEALTDQLGTAQVETPARTAEQERPPHY